MASSELGKGTTIKFTMRVYKKDERLSRLHHRDLNLEEPLQMSLILEESEHGTYDRKQSSNNI